MSELSTEVRGILDSVVSVNGHGNPQDALTALRGAITRIGDTVLSNAPGDVLPPDCQHYGESDQEPPPEVAEAAVTHLLEGIDPVLAQEHERLRERRDAAQRRRDEAYGIATRPTPEEAREAALEQLRDELLKHEGKAIATRLASVYKNGGQASGADYGLVLTDGNGGCLEVPLGDSKAILNPYHVQAVLLDALSDTFEAPSRTKWKTVAVLIARAAEPRDVAITADQVTREWVSEFLDRGYHDTAVDLSDSDRLHDVLANKPGAFTDTHGRMYLRPRDLHRYVTVVRGSRITEQQLTQRLGALGFRARQLSARRPGGGPVAKLRVWESRGRFDPDA